MSEYRLTEAESKIANIIWMNEPLPSPKLVLLCKEELKWEKSTTYTMLKKLELKELFQNEKGVVTSLVKREAFFVEQTEKIVEEGFHGSFPKFLTAFARNKKISEQEYEELQKLIDEFNTKSN